MFLFLILLLIGGSFYTGYQTNKFKTGLYLHTHNLSLCQQLPNDVPMEAVFILNGTPTPQYNISDVFS